MQSTKKLSTKKIACIISIFLLLLVLCCLFWMIWHTNLYIATPQSDSTTLVADIYQNGELIESINLSTVTESYTFIIAGENNCQNEIEVRPGSIGVISADCPDKLCVNQGFIHSSLLPITCLPNRLVIQVRTIENQNNDPAIDIITY